MRDARFADKRVINGVEFDAIGRRVAYWLRRDHPGEQSGMLTCARCWTACRPAK